jgi:hypothetical protein
VMACESYGMARWAFSELHVVLTAQLAPADSRRRWVKCARNCATARTDGKCKLLSVDGTRPSWNG